MKRTAIAAMMILGVAASLPAQEIPTDTVNVIGRHRPIIRDAEKMRLVPQIDDTSAVRRPVDIGIQSQMYPTRYIPKEIKAATLASKEDEALKKGHARLGFGNYTTPYAELFYNTGRSRFHQSGLHLKHLSSSGNIEEYPESGFSHNQVAVWSNYYLKKHSLKGKIMYDRDMYHLYGWRLDSFPEMDYDPDGLRQVYHKPAISLMATNEGSQSNVFYTVEGNYKFLGSRDSLYEHHVSAAAGVFGHPRILKIAKEQEIGLDIEYEMDHTKADTNFLHKGNHLTFIPYYQGTIDEFRFKAGLQVWLDIHDTTVEYKFFPDVHIDMSLIEKTLSLYAGIGGGLKSNDLHGLVEENPFLSRNLLIESYVQRFRLYGGLKASIGRRIDALALLEMANYDKMPFFVTDTSLFFRNRFNLVYAENVSTSKIGAELNFHANSKLNLSGRAYYYGYRAKDLTEVWHKPNWEVAIGGNYTIGERFSIRADFGLASPMKAQLFDAAGTEQVIELPATQDLNLELEYRFKGGLSVFVLGSNLLNQQQFRFYNYPSQGLRILGGITYTM